MFQICRDGLEYRGFRVQDAFGTQQVSRAYRGVWKFFKGKLGL
jgi:hypothetical protein